MYTIFSKEILYLRSGFRWIYYFCLSVYNGTRIRNNFLLIKIYSIQNICDLIKRFFQPYFHMQY